MKKNIFCFVTLVFFSAAVLSAETRKAAVAGAFYPANKAELANFVDSALSRKSFKNAGKIVGILSPHAGYEFSGKVAGFAYAAIKTKYDIVVLAGPSHRMYIEGGAVYPVGYFETPLGKIKIASKLAKKLIGDEPLFKENKKAHMFEHSLETQLPFLQRKLKNKFQIIPILVNTDKTEEIKKMAKALVKILKGKNVLFVASSDFAHYPSAETAEKSDNTVLAAAASMNSDYFAASVRAVMGKRIKGLETAACGESAIALVMEAAKILGADSFKILKQSNSFAENPAKLSSMSVVGYASGLFVKSGKKKSAFKIKLDKNEEKYLLSLARKAIQTELKGEDMKLGLSKKPKFNLPAAIFVTLKEKGNLRGCVGTTAARMTLRDSVIAYAKAAAFSDSRFRPVNLKELKDVNIEISILSPLRKVKSADDIIPLKNGVVLERNARSGLFLPQVWEQIPGKGNFLSEICSQKAGLEKDCWKDKDTNLYVFTVDSFEE